LTSKKQLLNKILLVPPESFLNPCNFKLFDSFSNIKEFDIQLRVNERKTDKMQKVRFESVFIPKQPKPLIKSDLYIRLYE